jgi:hypothetical protein
VRGGVPLTWSKFYAVSRESSGHTAFVVVECGEMWFVRISFPGEHGVATREELRAKLNPKRESGAA